MKTYTFDDIKPFLKEYIVKGSPENKSFNRAAPAHEANSDDLVWINKGKQEVAEKTKAQLILCHPTIEITSQMQEDKCYIVVENPKQIFAKIVDTLFSQAEKITGIHPTAIIDPEADIHESVGIGAYCVIGKCTIGEGSQIGEFCKIYDNVRIGKNVRVYERCNLGGAGFGFAIDDKSGELTHMPHIGGLIIEDEVDLFPFVNVDRGTLGNTQIGKGTKIDHFCHISHNTVIGEHCLITAQVVTCGGSSIGSRCWVGIGSIIKQSIRVGNKVTIGLGAVVTKDIPDGETWLGVPAQEISEFLVTAKKIKNL